MSCYLFRFTFTAEAAKKMVANPQDRREAAAKVFAAHGGRMLSYYWMMGEFDGLAICDLPDNKAAASVSMTVAASGAFSRFETTPLLTMEEALESLQSANRATGAYQPPGGSA
jgi:uncharacterized protein with GYD domain